MSDTPQKKKFVSRDFQRFIAVAYVLSEPELKVTKPFPGEKEGRPYCRFLASTGSPYGSSSDAIFAVLLENKAAELFCTAPRKGTKHLFDLQLRTWNKETPGAKYPERVTEFVGNFSFIDKVAPKSTDGQPATEPSTNPPPKVDKPQLDEDVPF